MRPSCRRVVMPSQLYTPTNHGTWLCSRHIFFSLIQKREHCPPPLYGLLDGHGVRRLANLRVSPTGVLRESLCLCWRCHKVFAATDHECVLNERAWSEVGHTVGVMVFVESH